MTEPYMYQKQRFTVAQVTDVSIVTVSINVNTITFLIFVIGEKHCVLTCIKWVEMKMN